MRYWLCVCGRFLWWRLGRDFNGWLDRPVHSRNRYRPIETRLGGWVSLSCFWFFAGIVSLGISHFVHPIDDRLVTLASLIVLLPGFSLTMALTELAVGHLSAGVARLAGAAVTLVTLFLEWQSLGGLRGVES